MNGVSLNGEPRGSAKSRRIVHFAVTKDQYDVLQDMALLAKMNVSEYIRYCVFIRSNRLDK